MAQYFKCLEIALVDSLLAGVCCKVSLSKWLRQQAGAARVPWQKTSVVTLTHNGQLPAPVHFHQKPRKQKKGVKNRVRKCCLNKCRWLLNLCGRTRSSWGLPGIWHRKWLQRQKNALCQGVVSELKAVGPAVKYKSDWQHLWRNSIYSVHKKAGNLRICSKLLCFATSLIFWRHHTLSLLS